MDHHFEVDLSMVRINLEDEVNKLQAIVGQQDSRLNRLEEAILIICQVLKQDVFQSQMAKLASPASQPRLCLAKPRINAQPIIKACTRPAKALLSLEIHIQEPTHG